MCSYAKRIAITKNINKIKLIGLMAVYKKKHIIFIVAFVKGKGKHQPLTLYILMFSFNS
jgi:hypothetical protein